MVFSRRYGDKAELDRITEEWNGIPEKLLIPGAPTEIFTELIQMDLSGRSIELTKHGLGTAQTRRAADVPGMPASCLPLVIASVATRGWN